MELIIRTLTARELLHPLASWHNDSQSARHSVLGKETSCFVRWFIQGKDAQDHRHLVRGRGFIESITATMPGFTGFSRITIRRQEIPPMYACVLTILID